MQCFKKAWLDATLNLACRMLQESSATPWTKAELLCPCCEHFHILHLNATL